MEGLSQEYRKTKELEIKYQNTNGRRILNLIPRGVQICIPLKLRTPDGKSNSNSVFSRFFVKFWGIQDFNIIDLDNT